MGDLHRRDNCYPPMDLMRSEPMQLLQIIIPVESSHLTVSDLALLQFKDLNADKSPFQRSYAAQVVAQILQETAVGKKYASDKLRGARRLCDAIILGYQLQRVLGRDNSIPEWYANVENELGLFSRSPNVDEENVKDNSINNLF